MNTKPKLVCYVFPDYNMNNNSLFIESLTVPLSVHSFEVFSENTV